MRLNEEILCNERQWKKFSLIKYEVRLVPHSGFQIQNEAGGGVIPSHFEGSQATSAKHELRWPTSHADGI